MPLSFSGTGVCVLRAAQTRAMSRVAVGVRPIADLWPWIEMMVVTLPPKAYPARKCRSCFVACPGLRSDGLGPLLDQRTNHLLHGGETQERSLRTARARERVNTSRPSQRD